MASSGNNRSIPQFVYRGDGRPPSVIFRDGFTSRGEDDDVIEHIKGGSNLLKSGYISTSQSLRIPAVFMQPVTIKDPKTGQEKFETYRGTTGHKWEYTHRKGWVYFIDTTNLEALYAPDQLTGDNASLKPLYNYQQEWSVKRTIPGKNIKQAQHVDGFIYRNDLFDGRGPFPVAPPESEKPTPFKEITKNLNYGFNH